MLEMLETLYKIGEVRFRLLGTNGLDAAIVKNERFTPACSRCPRNLKNENFTSSFGKLRKKSEPKRVLHVELDLFFLIQPIKSLICGVVVAVLVSRLNSLLGSLRKQDVDGSENVI